MLLVTEAQAQTAEAIKAAGQAADTLMQYQAVGAFAILLTIALGWQSWRNMKLQDRCADLASQLATIAANSTSAIASHASATDRMQAAQATAAETLRDQGAETAKEISELRHAQNNHLAGVNAVMELLARQRQGAA
ncbi:hypothetical protein [Methylobacterium sp. B4]|uniref:hypothetical protein n=1 Tax=Methylobacterium sp. B4 TaxID=1938755 RepID=UPI000D7541EF|nr:hypothetical protein [Methylobacterium sp. B4]